MKALVNIINEQQIAEIRETYPNFDGTFTINGTTFLRGEWVHVDDSFVVPDNRKPFIKDATWILRYLVRQRLREYNLHQWAQGVKDFAEMYSQDVPDLATVILSIAPEDEIAE